MGRSSDGGPGAVTRPREALSAPNYVGRQARDLEVPKMDRVPTVMGLNADPRGRDNGPASDPMAAVRAKHSSRLGPADGWILAAFTASVTAGIVIWAAALGYLHF